jgi:hypothetical protein
MELVPFFVGVLTGETGALVDSFAGEPELHHPVRGRIKGVAAFERFVEETRSWLTEQSASTEDVEFVIVRGGGIEESVLHVGDVHVPVAIASDKDERRRIVEQRMYFSSWPLTGRHAIRPPVLQPTGDLRLPGGVGDYQRALAAGDVDGVLAAFGPDASVREPAGGRTCIVAPTRCARSVGGSSPTAVGSSSSTARWRMTVGRVRWSTTW